MKNGEKPAYPTDEVIEKIGDNWGLTKKEKFAMSIMQGILSTGLLEPNQPDVEYAAQVSVKAADALLKALEQ